MVEKTKTVIYCKYSRTPFEAAFYSNGGEFVLYEKLNQQT